MICNVVDVFALISDFSKAKRGVALRIAPVARCWGEG